MLNKKLFLYRIQEWKDFKKIDKLYKTKYRWSRCTKHHIELFYYLSDYTLKLELCFMYDIMAIILHSTQSSSIVS